MVDALSLCGLAEGSVRDDSFCRRLSQYSRMQAALRPSLTTFTVHGQLSEHSGKPVFVNDT